MGMLNHNYKNYHNKNLDHPAKIVTKHKMTPDDIKVNHKNKNDKKSGIKSITIPVNIRVDNHIRNDINALIQLGRADDNKDFVSDLVKAIINKLSPEDYKRFNDLKHILEAKDVLNYKLKHKSK